MVAETALGKTPLPVEDKSEKKNKEEKGNMKGISQVIWLQVKNK